MLKPICHQKYYGAKPPQDLCSYREDLWKRPEQHQ